MSPLDAKMAKVKLQLDELVNDKKYYEALPITIMHAIKYIFIHFKLPISVYISTETVTCVSRRRIQLSGIGYSLHEVHVYVVSNS